MLLKTLAVHLGRRLLILVMMTAIQPLTSSASFQDEMDEIDSSITGAKPGCQSQCGNLTIPYPFGIDDGCSMNKQFVITCNTSYNPPRAFLDYDTAFVSFPYSFLRQPMEVLFISTGRVSIRNYPTVLCYDSRGNVTTNYTPWWIINEPYRFPSTDHKFTVVGCNHYGTFGPAPTESYWGSCLSQCISLDVNTYCSGLGCCQASVPNFLGKFYIQLKITDSTGNLGHVNACTFAFMRPAYGLWNQFYFRGTPDLMHPAVVSDRVIESVPIVLDWGVTGAKNCTEARANKTSYACQANSNCTDLDPGYRCTCPIGFQGNPYLAPGCEDIDECEGDNGNRCAGTCTNTFGSYHCTCPRGYKSENGSSCTKDLRYVALVGGTISALVAIFLFLICFRLILVLRKRKRISQKKNYFERNGGLLLQQQMDTNQGAVNKIKIFTAEQLEKATDHFTVDRILGQGGQGTVYKGMLTDGRIVAIKKSKKVDDSQLGQFINELVILSQINHRNIVQLLGCCLETEVPSLVYEFIPNGTLSEQIHTTGEEFPITWEMRLQIAADSAGALAYLHSASSFPIYHRDIKSSNILLDEKYRAKVSDFGISRSLPVNCTHLTVTDACGTYGYMDPEYFQSSMFTEKSDVYSFGVVLVELLTGRRPIIPASPGSREYISSVSWFLASPHDQPDIFNQVVRADKEEELFAVANLARRCLYMDSKRQPTMKEVAMELEAIKTHNFAFSSKRSFSEADHRPASIEFEVEEHNYGFSTTSTFYLDSSLQSIDSNPLLFDTLNNHKFFQATHPSCRNS